MPAFLLLVIIAGCTSNKQHNGGPFPRLPLERLNGKGDQWGADIKLSITKSNVQDTVITYTIGATYNGRNIGFELMAPNPDSKKLLNVMRLKSTGKESDNFLKTLAALYKVKVDSNAQFVNTAKITYVDLGAFIRSVGEYVKDDNPDLAEYKLFLQGDNETGEMYLNINDKDHYIELKEKEDDFRQAIIRSIEKK